MQHANMMLRDGCTMREKKRPADGMIGRRVRELRKARKLTQAALARLLGVTVSTIKGWESGRHAIPTSRIRQLARALGYPPSALWQPVGTAVRPVKLADDPGGIEPDAFT
jgi:transcriptional regulator with XRE-family HTH domain